MVKFKLLPNNRHQIKWLWENKEEEKKTKTKIQLHGAFRNITGVVYRVIQQSFHQIWFVCQQFNVLTISSSFMIVLRIIRRTTYIYSLNIVPKYKAPTSIQHHRVHRMFSANCLFNEGNLNQFKCARDKS